MAITVDLVLQARGKMAGERVNGPEDSIASEMIKQLPQEKIRQYKMLPRSMYGAGGSSFFLEDREIGILAEARSWAQTRNKKLQDHCADCL